MKLISVSKLLSKLGESSFRELNLRIIYLDLAKSMMVQDWMNEVFLFNKVRLNTKFNHSRILRARGQSLGEGEKGGARGLKTLPAESSL